MSEFFLISFKESTTSCSDAFAPAVLFLTASIAASRVLSCSGSPRASVIAPSDIPRDKPDDARKA